MFQMKHIIDIEIAIFKPDNWIRNVKLLMFMCNHFRACADE